MTARTVAAHVALGISLALFTLDASGQIKGSELASVAQTIDGTTLKIEYSRPSLRGRDVHEDLFGDQIRHGELWTPGANQSTTLESNKAFRLNGTTVPAGKYSVWMAIEPEEWEFVLDPDDTRWHTQKPEPSEDQVRFPITPTTSNHSVETLVWYFPAVRSDGADLRMQWGDVTVDLKIAVEPTVRTTITAEEAAPYLGKWEVDAEENSYREAFTFETELRLDGAFLVGRVQWSEDFGMEMGFAPAAEQVFQLAGMMNGQILSVQDGLYWEFLLDEDGVAVSFEARDDDDDLQFSGRRIDRS